MQPKVTIITVTFNLIKDNREKFFRQCVESVHNQTYPNIEHIVMDGASTDGSLDLIREYEEKGWLKCYSEPDAGMVDAMNKGIKKANGEYVAILNSDDWYDQKAIELLVKKVLAEDADFSYGITDLLSREDGTVLDKMGEKSYDRFYLLIPFNHEAMLCKKSIYQKLNYYNWEQYDTIADYDFIQRLILNDYKGAYVDAVVLNFRMDGTTNLSSSEKENKKYKKHIKHLYCMYKNFYYAFMPVHLHQKLNEVFNKKEEYLSTNDFVYLESDEVMYYFLKFISEKRLKNYPYENLIQRLLSYRQIEWAEMRRLKQAPKNTDHIKKTDKYIKLFGIIPLLKVTIKN